MRVGLCCAAQCTCGVANGRTSLECVWKANRHSSLRCVVLASPCTGMQMLAGSWLRPSTGVTVAVPSPRS